MRIKIGDKLPNSELFYLDQNNDVKKIDILDLCKDKTIIFVSHNEKLIDCFESVYKFENVKIYEDLSNALKDATLIFGTSARSRTIPWPTKTSSELSIVLKKALESSNAKVCFVFGREISGLSNEELQMCDYHIKIPTDKDFSSINLSHAVQIISYVLKIEIDNIDFLPEMENESQTFQENEYLIDHFDEVMKKMDFYDQENPKQVKTRMRRLIKRLQPDKLETGILRGFLAKIEQILNKKN